MATWKLKACPKCSGDMFLVREDHEVGQRRWYKQCLQCSHQVEIEKEANYEEMALEDVPILEPLSTDYAL